MTILDLSTVIRSRVYAGKDIRFLFGSDTPSKIAVYIMKTKIKR